MDPQLQPPPDGDQNRKGALIGMVVGSVTFAGIFVALRMYTRLCLIKMVRWDDWTIVIAWVRYSFIRFKGLKADTIKFSTVAGMVLDLIDIHYGYGRHEYYLSPHQILEFNRIAYGDWIQTFFTLTISKVSICLLLLRIHPSERIRRPIQGLILFLILSNFILTLLYILQCIPVYAAWNFQERDKAKCFTKGQLQRVIITQASEISQTSLSVYANRASHLYCL